MSPAIFSSSVIRSPPSDQTFKFFSGCNENAPAFDQVPAFRPSISPSIDWQASSTTTNLYFSAILQTSRMSVIYPVKWTGTIAFVFSVIAASIFEVSMQKVSLQSTKTGIAPNSQIAPTVATNVLAAVITSSPGFMP